MKVSQVNCVKEIVHLQAVFQVTLYLSTSNFTKRVGDQTAYS